VKLRLLLTTLLAAFSFFAHAKTIVVGDIYEVKEKSLQQLIIERINASDMEEKLTTYTKSFEAGIFIPTAIVDKEFEFTPWYTLPAPIKDQNDQVLFPKGFRFNPLTKVRAPGRLVFFNEEHIDWVKEHLQEGDNLVMTSGDIYKAMKELNARVYLLDVQTHRRLKVNAVPSIYHQRPDEEHFTVNQYAL
jgi:hypothetical protein